MPRSLLLAGGFLAIFLGGFSVAAAQDDAKEKKGFLQEFKLPLRGEGEWRKEWNLIGHDTANCVKFENEGLRITLPAGFAGERPHTGLTTRLHVKGDFEITVKYEILKEPEPADTGKVPTRLLLIANMTPTDRAIFTRRVDEVEGAQFSIWNKIDNKFSVHPAKTKTGRLRLVRSGVQLSFWVAEPADAKFEHLREAMFGDDDLVDVKLLATTGGPNASFDVLFSDLHVRATALPNVQAVVLEKPVAPERPPAPAAEIAVPQGWLPAVLVISVVFIVLLALTIAGILIFIRQKTAATAASSKDGEEPAEAMPISDAVIFSCPACGKKLKANAALVGKNVKCVGCGEAALVSNTKS